MREWVPTFPAPLWLCAIYLSDIATAVLGLVWIAGRIVYFLGDRKAAHGRLPGFFIQSPVCFLPFLGGVAGLVTHRSGGATGEAARASYCARGRAFRRAGRATVGVVVASAVWDCNSA